MIYQPLEIKQIQQTEASYQQKASISQREQK